MPHLTENVDQLFAPWDTPETPGCVLAVIRDGEIIYSRAYGMADLERGVPLTTESIFDLGSTGKQFTAALMLLLEQQGVLSLADSIRKYLPELPAYSQAITIRHLIHHTSGLRDYTTLMYLANKPFENFYFDDELFDLIARQQGVNFAPGEEYIYCNTGYLLLGEIAKRAAGKPYTDLVRQHILEPLGMNATGFNDSFKRIVKNRALAYTANDDGGYTTDVSFCGGYGDGALISTVGDLLLWDRNFYDNRLGGGQSFIEQLVTPGRLNNGEAQDYAFGLMVSRYKGLKLVRHGGAWAGYRAEMIRFPEQRFSVICLANHTGINPSGLTLQVADLYLADRFSEAVSTSANPPAADDAPPATTPVMAGAYRSANGGSLARLSLDEGKYTLELMGYTFPMQPASESHLKATDSPIDIDLIAQDGETISISLQGQNPTRYGRLPPEAAEAAPAAEFVGVYRSAELEISYRVLLDGDELFVKRGYAPQEPMQRAAADLYASGFLIFEFFRGDDGEVGGFHLFADRVVNIRFERATHAG